MTEIVVGCPVRDRAWVLPHYFSHVGAACDEVGMKPEFVFAVSRHDLDTQDAIQEGAASLHCVADMIFTEEPLRADIRDWRESRFKEMAVVRNLVMDRVRQIAPSYFWSLDSDMLPAPDALLEALPHLRSGKFQAVGMRSYMSKVGVSLPSYAQLCRNVPVGRYDARDGCFPVQVIMANSLMIQPAYSVNWKADFQGEDIGFARNCSDAGVKFGWCATARCKHVMGKEMLDQVDERVGF